MQYRRLVPVALLLLPLAAYAIDPPNFSSQYLVPVYADAVPGAGGSQWQTELTVFHTGSTDVKLIAPVCQHMLPMPCDDEVMLTAGKAKSLRLVPKVAGGGALIYFDDAPGQPMQLRVRDLSADSKGWGAEIPIVPTLDFTEDVYLVDIPNDPRYRATLRLYSLSANVSATVKVSPLYDGPVIGENTYRLTTFLQLGDTYTFTPLHPDYAQVDPLSAAVRASGHERLRLHVHFHKNGPNFFPPRGWAFVSLTNNETQQVTVVTPQRHALVPTLPF